MGEIVDMNFGFFGFEKIWFFISSSPGALFIIIFA